MRSPIEKTVSPDERKDLKTSRRHPHPIHAIQHPTLPFTPTFRCDSAYASDGLICCNFV
ncbi:hypothetical protein SCLCIDRAFT_1224319 [Scleroderma citrinum Foug A]|uniref:Uncharacterized protein n=1 Tax=Scleroderma citrinum Foug A TaxID=1036808 RepID=A0A0C3D5F4_9AGAM|nr:hypothetical protein SCLCIDRAFT_1224319 [Scleroderma citrinum Foug A]